MDMKLDSKYLEGLRIRPDVERVPRRDVPPCDWPGCTNPGEHPAPKGRDREGEYFMFCLEHVRRYNKSYNYFSGMADEELRAWLERNVTGHRPTWRMGARHMPGEGAFHATFRPGQSWHDVHGLFGPDAATGPRAGTRRRLPAAVMEALGILGLDESADAAAIKARYKKLVKELHPDRHGGNKAKEARLRVVIEAYQKLRKARLC